MSFNFDKLKLQIELLTSQKDDIDFLSNAENVNDINSIIDLMDNGQLSIFEYNNQSNQWILNHWLKKIILFYFKINKTKVINIDSYKCYDKVPLKFSSFTDDDFNNLSARIVPGAIIRKSAYIGKNVVVMPSFINVGAYVDDNTMIDTWATVGSCARVGKNCHISGGVGIGGVLEPLNERPIIIEDDCFIGARSELAEGAFIDKGSVISMGVYIGKSTAIVDQTSGGKITYDGYIPPYSVVIPGSLKINDSVSKYCNVIIKKVDENTRKKTAINDILREI